jgi:hypothetical protein
MWWNGNRAWDALLSERSDCGKRTIRLTISKLAEIPWRCQSITAVPGRGSISSMTYLLVSATESTIKMRYHHYICWWPQDSGMWAGWPQCRRHPHNPPSCSRGEVYKSPARLLGTQQLTMANFDITIPFPQLPQRHGLTSTTFRPPLLDGSLTFGELLDSHLTNSPDHPAFIYTSNDGPLEELYWKDYIYAVHRAGRYVNEAFGFDSSFAEKPIVGVLASSGVHIYNFGDFRSPYCMCCFRQSHVFRCWGWHHSSWMYRFPYFYSEFRSSPCTSSYKV